MVSQNGTANRWQGYSHRELYDMINSGPGGGAAGASAEQWSGLSSALTEIQQDIASGVTNSGATWTGTAADQARGALSPLGDWAEQASTAADVMRASAELQGDLLGKARADMPLPIPVSGEQPHGFTSFMNQVISGQIDHEILEAASNAAERRAHQVMAAYESGTTDNTNTLGDFGQPPTVVVDDEPIVAAAARAREPESHRIPRARTAPGSKRAVTEEEPPEERPTTNSTERPAPAPAATEPEPDTNSAATPEPTQPTPAKPAPVATPEPESPPAASAPAPAPAASTPPKTASVTTSSSAAPSSAAAAQKPAPAPTTTSSAAESSATAVPAAPSRDSDRSGSSGSPTAAGSAMLAPRAARRRDDEEDEVLGTPDYLVQADDVFGYSSVQKLVSPPVIGDAG